MDKHYLTPLFSPQSVLVFAGNQEDAAAAFAQAKALYANLTAQRFNGEIRFVDIQTTGTLADLALPCTSFFLPLPGPQPPPCEAVR